ncbi:hypothetical protein [Streptomyces sp. Tue6028]|uniref:hypothetical protein n=1 Tax=Streptomyces sp. Tue6028 TaxID=2036037 RepID=UPI003EBA3DCC
MIVSVRGQVRMPGGASAEGCTASLWQHHAGELLDRGRAACSREGGFSAEVSLPDDTVWPPVVLVQLDRAGRVLPTRPALVRFPPRPTAGPGVIDVSVTEAFTTEPTLGEVAASVATAAGAMQRELSHYPVPGGAFNAEVEIALPVATGVDELGRFRVRVVDAAAPEGQPLRLTVRPAPGAPAATPAPPPVDLEPLGLLNSHQLRRLRDLRIHDLAELATLLGRPAARLALVPLDLPETPIADCHTLLFGSGLPVALALALVQVGVRSVAVFLAADPKDLAERIRTRWPTDAEGVARWQERVRALMLPRGPD